MPRQPSFVLMPRGGWGCGALCQNRWFQLEWPGEWSDTSIAPKELVPVVVAVAVWGFIFAGSSVRVRSDNLAVVCCINKGSARDPALSRLLRLLGLFCAVLGISLSAHHIPGAANQSADALSRGNLPLFFSQTPQAGPVPTHLPTSLLELVLNQKLTVASKQWMELSLAICQSVLHPPHVQPTHRPNDATLHSAANMA